MTVPANVAWIVPPFPFGKEMAPVTALPWVGPANVRVRVAEVNESKMGCDEFDRFVYRPAITGALIVSVLPETVPWAFSKPRVSSTG